MLSGLRLSAYSLIFLRRISRALDVQNKLLTEQNLLARMTLEITHPAAYKAHLTRKERTGRMTEISVASVEDWNKQWYDSHPDEEETG